MKSSSTCAAGWSGTNLICRDERNNFLTFSNKFHGGPATKVIRFRGDYSACDGSSTYNGSPAGFESGLKGDGRTAKVKSVVGFEDCTTLRP